ncbi:hypothetical protein TWF506_009873 [Arthrobotrys conoides]|uniref:Uncharacterized protein n=1 Tax=Arthrobotrys conoides TaxID=74498 RepID=A0AAN8RQL8_9PEZI
MWQLNLKICGLIGAAFTIYFSISSAIAQSISIGWSSFYMNLQSSKAGQHQKREEMYQGTFWIRDTPAGQVLEKLNKRQAEPDTCKCFEGLSETYSTTVPLTYFAMPFEGCDVRDITSNLCPLRFGCVCQQTGISMCLPTDIQSDTDCGTIYSGPTTYPLQEFTWLLSGPLPEFAYPTEQCGGVPGITSLAWRTEQTKCPKTQACVCESVSSGKVLYARCRDTSLIPPNLASGGCATTCKYEFGLDVPPPTATARIGGQCGGRCWPGPRNCPPSATCFTETGPTPGAYAECGYTNPSRRLKVRRDNYQVLSGNLPARVQAMATPIYF